MKFEKELQLLDLTVTILLFMLACLIGRICINKYGDLCLMFYVSVLAMILTGEIIWRKVRKHLKDQWEQRHDNL